LYYRVADTAANVSTQAWKTYPENTELLEASTAPYIQLKVVMYDVDTATTNASVNSLRYSWFSGTDSRYAPKAIVYNDKYYLTSSTGQTPYIDSMLTLSAVPGLHWTAYTLACQGVSLFNSGLYCAKAATTTIAHLDTGYTDGGAAIPFTYETGDSLVNYPYYPKYLQYIFIDYARQFGQSFNLGYSTDGGLTWTNKAVDMGSGLVKNRGAYRWAVSAPPSTMYRIRVQSDGTLIPLTIYGMDVVGTIRNIFDGGR